MRRTQLILMAMAALLLTGACSSSHSSSAASGSSTTAAGGSGHGPVDVLYAASLTRLMNQLVAPAFNSSSGYNFTGFAGESGALANELKGKAQTGDVFISASAAKDKVLEGRSNGNLVTWYARFASSPLLLAYNPKSKFAADFKSKPWYQVLTEPGILVGRTDPATDPKGALTVQAVGDAVKSDNAPGLATITRATSNVFPEAALVSRLQSGNLDVGFFYAVEASTAKLPTVPLTGVPSTLGANYTVTVLSNAPHQAAAMAFVEYLLGPQGAAQLAQAGLTLTKPAVVVGTAPSALQAVLSGR